MNTTTTSPATPDAPAAAASVSKVARMLRSGAAYTIAPVVSRGIGFLLLPVFTRILSPSDYGQLSVALSVNSVASLVFALGLDVAVFRGLFQLSDDPPTRARFFRSIWTFLMVAPLLMALVAMIVLAPILGTSQILSVGFLALSLTAAVVSVAATTVPLAVLRAENRIRHYLLVTGSIAITSTCLTVILVVWVRTGIVGWLVSLIVANLIGFGLAIRVVPYARPRPFDFPAVRKALRLSLPIVPHFASLWALQLADRVLVATLLSTAAAGVYSLASNLALPMFMVVLGFGQAFMPDYARAGKAGGSKDSLRRTIALQVAVVATLCVACALLAPVAVHLLTDARYDSAAALVPWLVLGYGFLGLYAIPMNGLTLTHGRTQRVFIVSGFGAVTNIGLIVGLAPVYGLEAVAIASAVGYGVLLACVLLFASYRHATLRYPRRRIAATLGLALAGYMGGVLSSSDTSVADVVIRSAWSVAAAGAIGMVAVGPKALLRNGVSLRIIGERH
jgi:O-antigen/teichoic acid export membrane protein